MGLGPDSTYSGQSKIYRKQQPENATSNGQEIITEEVFDNGSLVQHYGQETYRGTVEPAGCTITAAPYGAGGTHQCEVTIQLTDGAGNALADVPANLDVLLSASPYGAGLGAAPTVSTTVATGLTLSTYSANLAFRIQTTATGEIQIIIDDASKTLYYIAVFGLPVPVVSAQLTAADYS